MMIGFENELVYEAVLDCSALKTKPLLYTCSSDLGIFSKEPEIKEHKNAASS